MKLSTSPRAQTWPTALTIAIPTYGREHILVETIDTILKEVSPSNEIILIDQTREHTSTVAERLAEWNEKGAIRLLKPLMPNIPAAMNIGLAAARGEIVLFLDDDVVPEPGLIKAHMDAHQKPGVGLVAGRVIQPWQEGIDFSGDTELNFASPNPAFIDHFMGGNFSIRRDLAIELGGFDENFVSVAYNFEAELAYRLLKSGYRIWFEPRACIHHLKISTGGTRTFGLHLTTWRPDHSVGAYYYILRTWGGTTSLKALLWRPLRAVSTRHHLTRPWWIPLTLIGEVRGLTWALLLLHKGPAYIGSLLAVADSEG